MPELIPYPSIGDLGVIGDRRTAALVASDGSIQWLCLPDYDGVPVFGALLDAQRGGVWRIGPVRLHRGDQRYRHGTATLVTTWSTADYELRLDDCMARPADERTSREDHARVVIRRLRCTRGHVECASVFRPAVDFAPVDARPIGELPRVGGYTYWASVASWRTPDASGRLDAGDEVWWVFEMGTRSEWATELALRLQTEAEEQWQGFVSRLSGALDDRLLRSAITIRLLEYAPSGSVVAAPATSLPERIGGRWNVDYRLTWVRDASLSMWSLARLGDIASAKRYLHWLTKVQRRDDPPLRVLYRIDGTTNAEQQERTGIQGYRGSLPVRRGNHAYRQRQMDIFGYLADCAREYLQRGGDPEPQLWELLKRAANYVASHWRDKGNGIWELPIMQRYIGSLIMCWVTLERVQEMRRMFGADPGDAERWRTEADTIRQCLLEHGWSGRLGAFQQSLENETLDASTLLCVITGFLPPDDERVVRTVDRIAERLTIDGCVYRFDPLQVRGFGDAPMGQFEGAFVPCTFWLATACALMGRTRDAQQVIARVERVAGSLGLFGEGIDPRSDQMTGNTPLLFSHVEYVRALSALAR